MNEKEYDKKIREALDSRDGGKTQECLSNLVQIFEEIPATDIKALVVVGSLLREGNESSKALYCFDKAISEDPNSSRASLGLFHSLWRLERYDEAFDELERFLSIAESEAHFMLLKEMSEGFFDEAVGKINDPFTLIKRLREDLSASLQANRSY